jgi:hypothetical protein
LRQIRSSKQGFGFFFCNFPPLNVLSNGTFDKILKHEYNYSRNYAVEVMFLTLFSNKVLETMVDTNDEWITNEQELKKEELKDEDKGTSHLAIKAAQDLLLNHVDPLEIDMIIMATATPDMPVASTGVCCYQLVQQMLLLMIYKHVLVFYTECQLQQLHSIRDIKKVLLIGADKILVIYRSFYLLFLVMVQVLFYLSQL